MDKKTLRATNEELRFWDDALDQQLAIQLVGGGTWTVVFEASLDALTWSACPVQPLAGGATVTTTSAAGMWVAYPGAVGTPSLKGFKFRCRATVATNPPDVIFQPTRV